MSQTVKHICVVSGKELHPVRVAALEMLEVPRDKWTLKEYSTMVATPVRVSVRDKHGLIARKGKH